MNNPFPIKRAWRIESRRKEVDYATRCFFCDETDIFCFEIEHPVTKKLDEHFKRAVCRNCHRKLEFQRDIKGLTKNGQHDTNETAYEALKRYLLVMAEDLASVGERFQECPELSRELVVADYKARAASLRRIANAPPLTPKLASRTISKKKPSAETQSPFRADAGQSSAKTRRNPKQS